MEQMTVFLALLMLSGFVLVFWRLDRILKKVDAIDERLASWERDLNAWATGLDDQKEKPSLATVLSRMPTVGNDEDFHRE